MLKKRSSITSDIEKNQLSNLRSERVYHITRENKYFAFVI